MAATYSCDGCGNPVEKPIVLGKITKRDYCERCAELANQFMEREEALRKDVAESFRRGREALITLYQMDDMYLKLLPDVPDAQAGSALQPRQAGAE